MFQILLKKSATTLSAIYAHPFNRQLQNGSLPKQTFQHYLQQDALYLHDFANMLTILSQRLPDPLHRTQFERLAKDTVQAELDLNNRYFPQPTPYNFFSSLSAIEKIPVIRDYTAHLLHTAEHAPIDVAIASCTPCFWIYKELGVRMSQETPVPGNPCQDWIDTYSAPEFIDSTNQLIKTFNQIADKKHLETMSQVFLKSARFELIFFEAALAMNKQLTEENIFSTTTPIIAML